MHREGQRGQEHDNEAEPVVGRATQQEKHAPGANQDSRPVKPLFDDDVEWEDLDDAHHLMSAAPPANAVPVAAPADDPKALETIYSDGKKKSDFEKHGATKKCVRTGKYNKAAVKSDKTTGQVAGRPGVVISDHGHHDGTFMLKNATATRYVFIRRGGQNIAQPFDVIEKAKLSDHNYRANGQKSDKQGHTQRILLNPSQPRVLHINNKPETCVLSWIDGQTAAWIPVAQLKGQHGQDPQRGPLTREALEPGPRFERSEQAPQGVASLHHPQ
jgi:hypothetical protein